METIEGYVVPLRFYAPPGVTVTEETLVMASTNNFYGVSKTIGADYIDVAVLFDLVDDNPLQSAVLSLFPTVVIAWTDTAYDQYTVRDMQLMLLYVLEAVRSGSVVQDPDDEK